MAQSGSVKAPTVHFGEISPGDFQGNPFPGDTTAEAIVLYHLGQTIIDDGPTGWGLVTEVFKRIRIVKKSATDRATVSFPLYQRPAGQSQRVDVVEGMTFNLVDGQIQIDKLSQSGVVTERAMDNVTLQKFTLPNVREGSIIDYRYRIYSPFSVAHSPRSWYFQGDIPSLWSEYRFTFPNNFPYRMIKSGYAALTINEFKDEEVDMPSLVVPSSGIITSSRVAGQSYRFATTNLPALRPEAYITTTEDYVSKIDFELIQAIIPNRLPQKFSTTWEDLDKTLLAEYEFGQQYKSAAFLRDAATAIAATTPATDTLGRVSAAHQFVSRSMKWDETNGLYSKNIRKAFEAKKGDPGDINLIIIALLRELGLNANPVVLSTRDHGRLNEDWALLKSLNYVVAHVLLGGKDFLLDATDPFLKPGMLPLRAMNQTGRLVLSKNAGRFVALNPTERANDLTTAQFRLAEDGTITGTLTHSLGGYDSYKARKAYTLQGETDYLAEIRKKYSDWQIEKVTFDNTDNPTKAFTETYHMSLTDGATVAAERLYVRPMLTEGRSTNPFREPTRQYPVDFGMQTDETYSATFSLPPGYVVDELPKPVAMTLPDGGGRFVFQATTTGPTVQITSRLSLRKPMYYAQEYPALRELFAQVVAKHAEMVVFKKK